MHPLTPRQAGAPFDPRLSARLDRLIASLEAAHDDQRLRRAWLRLSKRLAERRVPPFQPRREAAR